MVRITCEHCETTVNESYLRKHQQTGKCMAAQGRHAKITHDCVHCGESFLRPYHLRRHEEKCKRKKQSGTIEEQLRAEVQRLRVRDAAQEDELAELELENTFLRKEIAILKASPPATTIINNGPVVNIRVDKFIVKQHAKDNFMALTDGVLRQCLAISVDPRLLLGGAEAVAQLILETSLCGQDKVACTDSSRSVVVWKDVDHTVITDMKMRKLMPRLVRPIYGPYNEAWRNDKSMDSDQYRKIGDVLHRLNMISQKRDTKSRFYNTVARIIMDANCDLSFMLEEEEVEEDEHEHDEDGNSIEYLSSDSD